MDLQGINKLPSCVLVATSQLAWLLQLALLFYWIDDKVEIDENAL